MQIMNMLADGRITISEIATAAKAIGAMYGIDLSPASPHVYLFEEADGDLHVVLKKTLLDELSIDVD